MARRRPPRLIGFEYVGCYRYFVTCCTAARRLVFVSEDAVEPVRAQFLRTAMEQDFAVLAYVFMPDHMHWLVEGLSPNADFRRLMMTARRRTSCRHRVEGSRHPSLWQDGYYERVLRRHEDVSVVVRYILDNPVRAGLIGDWQEYPFSWGRL